MRKYMEQNSAPIENDMKLWRRMGLDAIGSGSVARRPKVRHNPAAIARVAVEMAMEARKRISN